MWRGKLLRGLEEALKGWIVGEHEEMRDSKKLAVLLVTQGTSITRVICLELGIHPSNGSQAKL
uniref:Uncharacterized protein n=1 Tax=Lepeophtheirus salmonis TaxID=72036 RepID=A0A0K2V3N4_LEPSM